MINLCMPYQFISLAEETHNDILDSLNMVVDCGDEILEAQADSKSERSTNDWRSAIYKDHLPWNYFHIMVQKEICAR